MSKTNNKHTLKSIIRLGVFFSTLLMVVGICIFCINKFGILERINSVEKIRELVEGGGVYSSIVFVILQILQTTILQVPSAFVTIAGVVAFGPNKAFVLSFIAIMTGSIIMFFMGRFCGKRFLNFILGEEKTKKLVDLISNGKYAFFIMMIFPFFPDDILCAVAGVGNISFRYFLFTNIIARLIGVAGCVFFGNSLMQINSSNLIFWIILGVFILVLLVFVIKNNDKIDEFINKISPKKILKKR